MRGLIVFLVFISMVSIVVGMIKPALVIRWGKIRNRKMVLLVYGGLFVVCCFMASKFIKTATGLDEALADQDNVYTLDLSRKNLSQVDSRLSKLTNLKTLKLTNNKFEEVPSEAFQLEVLNYLVMDSNQITTIPSDLNKLERLLELNLSNNPISEIPTWVSTWKHVTLNLSNTNISSVPAEVKSAMSNGDISINLQNTPYQKQLDAQIAKEEKKYKDSHEEAEGGFWVYAKDRFSGKEYGEEIVYGELSLYYRNYVKKEEADAVANYLHEIGYGVKHGVTFQLEGHQQPVKSYTLKMCTGLKKEIDKETLESCKMMGWLVSSKCLKNAPVTIILCDTRLNEIQRIAWGGNNK